MVENSARVVCVQLILHLFRIWFCGTPSFFVLKYCEGKVDEDQEFSNNALSRIDSKCSFIPLPSFIIRRIALLSDRSSTCMFIPQILVSLRLLWGSHHKHPPPPPLSLPLPLALRSSFTTSVTWTLTCCRRQFINTKLWFFFLTTFNPLSYSSSIGSKVLNAGLCI